MKKIGIVLVAVAIAGFTSMAQGLNLGEIGSGTYVEFGPTDGGGDNVGIVSQSWDSWWPSGGMYDPTVGSSTYAQNGTESVGAYPGYPYLDGNGWGYMLLGLNPYTGEVVTALPSVNQYGEPGGPVEVYTDGPQTGNPWLREMINVTNPDYIPGNTTGDPQFDRSHMWVPEYGDAQLPTYDAAAQSRTGADFIWFNSEEHEIESGWSWVFGSHINVSSDGQIASTMVSLAAGPTTAVSSVVDTDYTYLYNGFASWGGGAYVGDTAQPNGGVGYLGFTMDGVEGWIELGGFSGDRSGVRIMSYYFDAAGGRLGDFDGDGDIDADDIDALGAAIQASSTDLAFDMDGDGFVTQADFNLHVTTLVDTALGEGSGTMFGDFNLDGVIDLLDLGVAGDEYGLGSGWATGDANGDGAVDLLDLGALGDNYGFAVTPIPEPATMTLLGLGAVALIRRRES